MDKEDVELKMGAIFACVYSGMFFR
jgi:hypothetical protein